MLPAINGMPDMLAAIARKDYENRRRRRAEGQAKAEAEGKYRTATGGMEDFRHLSLDSTPCVYNSEPPFSIRLTNSA
jgi:hypothetical protein